MCAEVSITHLDAFSITGSIFVAVWLYHAAHFKWECQRICDRFKILSSYQVVYPDKLRKLNYPYILRYLDFKLLTPCFLEPRMDLVSLRQGVFTLFISLKPIAVVVS